MIDLTDDLPLTRQAELLRLRRGSLDDHPRAVSAPDLAIMRRINLDYPFAGSRMLRELLRGEADCPPGYFLPARSLFPPLSFSAPPGTIIR
jgi:hypothetical protein